VGLVREPGDVTAFDHKPGRALASGFREAAGDTGR